MFIWKAVGGSCSSPRYLSFCTESSFHWISTTERRDCKVSTIHGDTFMGNTEGWNKPELSVKYVLGSRDDNVWQSVGQHFNNYWISFTVPRGWTLITLMFLTFPLASSWGPRWWFCLYNYWMEISRIKISTDVHVPLRMKCNDFGDPLTFYLAPSSGQHVHVSNTLVYDQIPTELQTFPSASVGLCVYC